MSLNDWIVTLDLLTPSQNHTWIDLAIGMAHRRLSRICIHCLATEEVSRSTSDKSNEFPFLRYATTSWVSHTKSSGARGVVQDDSLELFAWPSNGLVDLWVQIYGMIESHSSHCPPYSTSLIHIMSRYGVTGPLTAILRRANQAGGSVDSRDKMGWMALSQAARKITALLTTGKVDIDMKDRFGRTPLS